MSAYSKVRCAVLWRVGARESGCLGELALGRVDAWANWLLAIFWLTDEPRQSAPARQHASLGSKQSVNEAHGRVVFKHYGKATDITEQIESWVRTQVGLFTSLVQWAELSVSWQFPRGSPSSSRDVVVYVFDINQPSSPTLTFFFEFCFCFYFCLYGPFNCMALSTFNCSSGLISGLISL